MEDLRARQLTLNLTMILATLKPGIVPGQEARYVTLPSWDF